MPEAKADEAEQTEYMACRGSPAYFVDTFGVIDTADDGGTATGVGPFRLWPSQAPVMKTLAGSRMVLILKARQLGISWLVCGYVLWLSLFRKMQTVTLLSKDKDAAQELIGRIQKLYDRLPGWFKALCPAQTVGNAGDLEWANGSRVMSLAARPGAGRTFTGTVVMDEADLMEYGQQVYDDIRPIMEHAGQLIILSTAQGVGSLMHGLWSDAKAGKNDFTPVFLPWWSRPGRDEAWYETQVRNSRDPRSVPQDYPRNDVEAFTATGAGRFVPAWIAAQAANTQKPPIDPKLWGYTMRWRPGWHGMTGAIPAIQDVPGLRVYREPEPGRRYVIPADVAEGKDPEKGDYHSAIVLDADSLEECASLYGRWEPKDFAYYLMALSEPYRAVVIPERNSCGLSIITTMRTQHFPRIGVGYDGHWGWHTNTKTKPEGVDLLAEHLKENTIVIRSPETLTELQNFVRKPGGRLEAREGRDSHDDRVMMWVVGLSALRYQSLQRTARSMTSGPSPLAGYRG